MYNHKAAYSLRTYFKYSPHTQYVFRDSTSMDWDSILISHLDRKIPMYYAGWSLPNVNGHAFVCDGYQDSCYFHFNFGWSGQNNGYFYTSNLIVGGNNFNLAQEVIINCVPDTVNYTYPAYCSGEHNFKQRQGSIEDGSGPRHNYPPSSSCSWIIDPQDETDSISSIKLAFERFDLDAASSVDIYKGTSTADPLIGSFTGSTIPADIVSDHNKMLIVFTSGPASSAPGFYATFSTTSPVWCSGTTTITADTATFTDGSFGFNYHNGQSCKWKLISASGAPLTLNFRRFDTEPVNDNLKIYDLTTQALLAEYSGHYDSLNPPAPVTVESGQAFLIFSTNASETGQGWEIYYPKSNLGIDGNRLFPDLQIYPNPAKSDVTVKFTSTEPQQVTLVVTDTHGSIVTTFQKQATNGPNHWKLETGNLSPGIYSVSLSTIKGQEIRKLVIY
jgi:hypothetical protein